MRNLDHVTDAGVAALGAAQHLDAHDGLRARVVGDVEPRLHLNHCSVPNLSRHPDAPVSGTTRAGGQSWARRTGRSIERLARASGRPFGRSRNPWITARMRRNGNFGEAVDYARKPSGPVKRPRRSVPSSRPSPASSIVSASLTSNLPGAFDVQRLDHAVDDQHRIALRAHAHAARVRSNVRPVALAKSALPSAIMRTLPAVFWSRPQAPITNGVVDRDAPDLVDAGRLQRVGLLDVARARAWPSRSA